MWTLITASGSIDESWFYVVDVAIDLRSGSILGSFIDFGKAAADADEASMIEILESIAKEIAGLEELLKRMYNENLPAVFYQRVRRYLSGWLNDPMLPDGVFYGDEKAPRVYAGASAAQSPLICSLDAAFGVRHQNKADHEGVDTGVSSAGAYLTDMRQYMLRNHREFIRWLEDNLCIRDMVNKPSVSDHVKECFNECLRKLRSFRDVHLQIVTVYIKIQAVKCDGRMVGTGGSNPIQLLKETRSHMDAAFIRTKMAE